ncbi:MAG: WXG100 family type VII secretion target [Fretibacterium sp.]|nr:WXG100 family type VII secretion target [Fretibacterium sp.]
MAVIKITPESLESQAKTLRGQKAEHEQVYGKIKQLVESLVSEWQGEAQTAFVNSFHNKEAVFKQFAVEMESFAQFMDQAAQKMRATEEELKSRAQSL